MPDTAGGLALIDTLSIGGRQVTGMRLSGAAIASIVTSIPLPPVTRRAPPAAAPRCTPP